MNRLFTPQYGKNGLILLHHIDWETRGFTTPAGLHQYVLGTSNGETAQDTVEGIGLNTPDAITRLLRELNTITNGNSAQYVAQRSTHWVNIAAEGILWEQAQPSIETVLGSFVTELFPGTPGIHIADESAGERDIFTALQHPAYAA